MMIKSKFKRMTLTLAAAVAAAVTVSAQIPASYYSSLKGKKGAELKSAVYGIIKTATVLDYGSGAGKTWEGFYQTDRRDDNTVIDRYSDETFYFTSTNSSVSGMNIEHSFPKSWWGKAENQAYHDLYNLMPCEQNINSKKSNYPMGQVTTVTTDNGCTKIGTGNNGYMLWEPADKWKGDFARGYMYMATAYQDLTWTGTQALQILEQDEWPTLQQWAYTLYLQWARADVPDSIEIARNEAVSKIQGNRNPYVDFPNLMEYVWGDSIDYAFDPETTTKSSEVSNSDTPQPTTETVLDVAFTTDDGGFTTETQTAPTAGFDVWKRSSQYGWTASGYKSACYETDATLVSPEIDLTEYSDATLTFSHTANKGTASPSEMYAVEVRCDGTQTALDGITWPNGTSWTFVDAGNISLNEYVGKKIQLCFHYTSTATDAGTWEIKWVKVKATKPATAITTVTAERKAFDPSMPFKAYATDGRQVNPATHSGLMIIRQGGNSWKVIR